MKLPLKAKLLLKLKLLPLKVKNKLLPLKLLQKLLPLKLLPKLLTNQREHRRLGKKVMQMHHLFFCI